MTLTLKAPPQPRSGLRKPQQSQEILQPKGNTQSTWDSELAKPKREPVPPPSLPKPQGFTARIKKDYGGVGIIIRGSPDGKYVGIHAIKTDEFTVPARVNFRALEIDMKALKAEYQRDFSQARVWVNPEISETWPKVTPARGIKTLDV